MKKIDDLKAKKLIKSSANVTNQDNRRYFFNREGTKSIRQGN